MSSFHPQPSPKFGKVKILFWRNIFLRFAISKWYLLFLYFSSGILSSSIAQQNKTDSLISVLNLTAKDTNRINTFYNLADIVTETEPEKGIMYARRGLILSQELGFNKGQSICLNALGLAYYQMGKFDSAMINFEKRLEIVSKINDSIGIAGVYDNMSVIYVHRGEIDKALDLRLKANKIYSACNKIALIASGYTWIGNIYKEQGKYATALDYYLKALKAYGSDEQNIGYPLINISSIYRYLKQYDQARKYALEAQKAFIKSNNSRGIGVSLYRLALIYNEENDFGNSILNLQKAKEIFENIKDSYFSTLVDLQLGNCFRSLEEKELALKYFNSALPSAMLIGDKELIAAALENIGTVYNDKAEYFTALKYMHKSEKIFNEINDKQSLLSLFSNFVEIYSRLNQKDSVMYYFQKYQQFTDSINKEKSSKSIAEMRTKYETAKKDKEILTLKFESQKRKNVVLIITSVFVFFLVLSGSGFWIFRNKKKKEQKILNRNIGETNRKALRSQMNPHFIFNCIDSIERLIDEGEIKESKISLAKFSNLTRIVLENSMKREIPLSEEIEIIRLYMDLENMRFKTSFIYTVDIDSCIDPSTTLIPPLILQPFVENSIKHGFRNFEKPGLLKIEIVYEDESLACIVEDNGAGRKMHQNSKPISGFKKESIGIKLTEDRLKLIGDMKRKKSYLIIEDLVDIYNKPAGTRVKIFLPFEQSV